MDLVLKGLITQGQTVSRSTEKSTVMETNEEGRGAQSGEMPVLSGGVGEARRGTT